MKSVIVLVTGAAAGQFVAVAAMPILTRLYDPGEFGVLAVYAAILGILTVVASLSYEIAIPLPRSDRGAANVLAVAVATSLLVAGLSAAGVWVFGGLIADRTATPGLAGYLWLIPFALILTANYQIWSYWAIRTKTFGLIARTRLRQGLGSAGVRIGLGLAGLGPLGLILGQIVGEAAGVTALVKGARKATPRLVRYIAYRRMKWAARRYRRFPAMYSWSGLANALGQRLPVLLFAILHGPMTAGTLLLAERVVAMPMQLIGTAVGQVFFARAAGLAKRNRPALRRLYRRVAARLLLIGGLGAALVAAGGPSLFSFVLGDEWGDVGRFVRVLSIMYALEFAIIPVSQSLAVLERQGVKLASELLRLTAVAGAFGVAWVLAADPVETLALYAALSSASLLILLLLVDRSTRSTLA